MIGCCSRCRPPPPPGPGPFPRYRGTVWHRSLIPRPPCRAPKPCPPLDLCCVCVCPGHPEAMCPVCVGEVESVPLTGACVGGGSERRCVGSENRQTTPATSSTAPGTPTTGLHERGNDTSRSTGRSGRQNAATRRNMRRDDRVTVPGPVKKQRPDGMSHGRGGGMAPFSNSAPPGVGGGGGGSKDWTDFASGPSADQQLSPAPSAPIGLDQTFFAAVGASQNSAPPDRRRGGPPPAPLHTGGKQ